MSVPDVVGSPKPAACTTYSQVVSEPPAVQETVASVVEVTEADRPVGARQDGASSI